jgi:hypothetical protein
MKFHGPCSICVLAVLACRAEEAAPAAAQSPALGRVVAEMLAENPGWHLGTNEDCNNPALKTKLVNNSAYQAYRAIPDLNGDGRTDRIFVLIKSDSGKLYWIAGRDDGFEKARLIDYLAFVREGGLGISGQSVMFGPFDSDVGEGWRWDPKTNGFTRI